MIAGAWARAAAAADQCSAAVEALHKLVIAVTTPTDDPNVAMYDQEAREAYERGRREMAAELARDEIRKARLASAELLAYLDAAGA